MIRPEELRAIRAGEVDLAFRRWERPRVRVGTQLRTQVGLLEVRAVDRVPVSSLTAAQARRAGSPTLVALTRALSYKPGLPIWRVELAFAGADPREALRAAVPDADEVASLEAWLDRLDAASSIGPWTRTTLRIIARSPAVRAPDLATELGRPTAEFKRDVRKLKEKGLTESLDIGYRLSPRGAAVLGLDDGPAGQSGVSTSLPRIGAPANRALAAIGVTTLEQVAGRSRSELQALHGIGPHAIRVLEETLAARGEELTD